MSNEGFVPTPPGARALSLSATDKPAAPQEINKWRAAMQDPTHSTRYAERWERMETEGKDIDGERSEEHTSELQSRGHLVCRLLLEKKNKDADTMRARMTQKGA